MCKVLQISRSSFYYKKLPRKVDVTLENAVISEFRQSRSVFGARKLKYRLFKIHGLRVSRQKIGRIMEKYGLISKYTLRNNKGKRQGMAVNFEPLPNIVDRQFRDRKPLEVVVSDLTYIKCGGRWHYICLLLDLCNRKIIGSAVGRNKDAVLVRQAFFNVQGDLRNIQIFHTDRGSEFQNRIIDQIVKTFEMQRSLSARGTPVDNAVMESLYQTVKAEFAYGETFHDFYDLEIRWFDWVNWYNNVRPHETLGYLTPNEFAATIATLS